MPVPASRANSAGAARRCDRCACMCSIRIMRLRRASKCAILPARIVPDRHLTSARRTPSLPLPALSDAHHHRLQLQGRARRTAHRGRIPRGGRHDRPLAGMHAAAARPRSGHFAHARRRVAPGRAASSLRDQGTTVPVIVNGRPVGKGRDHPFTAGDEVRIAGYALRVGRARATPTSRRRHDDDPARRHASVLVGGRAARRAGPHRDGDRAAEPDGAEVAPRHLRGSRHAAAATAAPGRGDCRPAPRPAAQDPSTGRAAARRRRRGSRHSGRPHARAHGRGGRGHARDACAACSICSPPARTRSAKCAPTRRSSSRTTTIRSSSRPTSTRRSRIC